MGESAPRITDLSTIEPENFKYRNAAFLEGDSHYDVLPHQTRQELRDRIWNVRNGDIRRVLDEFPVAEPVVVQSALWMHAVVGKHFFPDANHRTAVALLRRLLRENGIDPGDWPIERTEQARAESHTIRRQIDPVRLDTLYHRDELFEVWRRYFQEVLDVNGDCE